MLVLMDEMQYTHLHRHLLCILYLQIKPSVWRANVWWVFVHKQSDTDFATHIGMKLRWVLGISDLNRCRLTI